MPELRRSLGLASLLFYGLGIILGAGIYAIIGPAAGIAGEGLWLSFALGAVVAALTGLSYAELATAMPQAGAEYVYLRRAFPRRRGVASVVGVVLAVSSVATAATVALAFAGYLGTLVALPKAAVALGLLAALTLLNLVGVREAGWVNAVFTVIEVAGLLLVIALGAMTPGFGQALLALPGPGVAAAAALVFFAFLGFEDIANLAEEARDPSRTIPRALLVSIALSTVLYVLVALAVLALAPPETLAGSPAPLAAAVATVSPNLAGALGGIALFATANTALIALVVASRTLFGLARGGDLPEPLARLLPGRRTPWVAALVAFGAAALLVLPFGDVAVIGAVSSFAALLAFGSVNLALIALRRREPGLERPFRVPGAVRRVPFPAVLGLVAAALLATQFEAQVYLVGGAALAVAVVIVLAYRAVGRQGRQPRSARRQGAS